MHLNMLLYKSLLEDNIRTAILPTPSTPLFLVKSCGGRVSGRRPQLAGRRQVKVIRAGGIRTPRPVRCAYRGGGGGGAPG